LTYTVDDDDGAVSNLATVRITITTTSTGIFESDDFNRCELDDSLWTFIRPLGVGSSTIVGTGSGDSHLLLSLPAGTGHDAWGAGGNEAPRIMQAVDSTGTGADFEMEVRFNQEPYGGLNDQGFIVEQDALNFLRFDTYHNGSALRVFVGSTVDGVNTTLLNSNIPVASASYQCVKRTGDTFTYYHSDDGAAWSEVHSFSRSGFSATSVGVFAANAGAQAFDCEVDYFFNTSAPIVAEDAGQLTVTANVVGSGSVIKMPDQGIYSCYDEVELLATPESGWGFTGWSGDLSGNSNPGRILILGPVNVTATFAPSTEASLVYANASGAGCITEVDSCATAIPIEIDRQDEAAPVGFFSVTFSLTDLALCDGLNSITEGTFLNSAGTTHFLTTDNGDGTYTVDGVTLGQPCGATDSTGVLFTIDVTNSVGSGTGTVIVTSVLLRDCSNQALEAWPGIPAFIPIETSPPPTVVDLHSAATTSGDSLGVTQILLNWSPVFPGDSVHIYRKGFGNYPEFDDGPGAGSVPSLPADPGAALAEGWSLAGATTGSSLADSPPARDFWYYVAFVATPCGHVSSVSNVTSGTLSYRLGDVAPLGAPPPPYGDNTVDVLDISLLGAHYNTSDGDALYLDTLDVGPTTDGTVGGRPQTDDQIQFEDLILFAVNFEPFSSKPGMRPLQPAASNVLTVLIPEMPPVGGTFEVELRASSDGSVQGMSLSLDWNEGAVEPITIKRGPWVDEQTGMTLLLPVGGAALDIVGFGQPLIGEGTLATITFSRKAPGDPGLVVDELIARDNRNRPVDVDERLVREDSNELPDFRVTRLLPSAPNPFRSQVDIAFELAVEGRVSIQIFGVDGRLVRTLVDEHVPVGRHQKRWDGHDNSGRRTAAGIYMVVLRSQGKRESQRIVKLVR
jgi:hypothetical protein